MSERGYWWERCVPLSVARWWAGEVSSYSVTCRNCWRDLGSIKRKAAPKRKGKRRG